MAKVRVHDLAKEFGVESQWVLSLLKELGAFVKSASSTVTPDVVAKLQAVYGEQLRAGVAPKQVEPVTDKAEGLRQVALIGLRERVTSWQDSIFDATGREIWERHGLGENDARLAEYLLHGGLFPEDLSLMLRGRRAVSRLRGGEEAWSLLVVEMRGARSSVPAARELPSTAVVRRRKAS